MKINLKHFAVYAAIFSLLLNFTACPNSSTSGGSGGEGTESQVDAGDFEIASTSVEMARNMAIGWNLGNTLDASADQWHTGVNSETAWGMPKTTKAMISGVKDAGFKTIRIPVSWHDHITEGTNYTIDSAWMTRVKEVVDYAYSQNMFVIINIHHDNFSISDLNGNDSKYGFALSDDTAIKEKSKAFIEKVWTQIATSFASYDKRLVFEVLNEPRDIGGEWKGNEWWTDSSDLVAVITEYEKTAIDAIRAVEGNEDRFIMVPGYAASGSESSILALYKMPKDSASDKLILSTHAYSPFQFAMSNTDDTVFGSDDKASLDSIFSYLKTNYTDKGIGVVMGEASASDKNNLPERIKWTEYYFAKAHDAKIPVVLWDNMVTAGNGGDIEGGECHGYFDRNNLSWYFPTMIDAMMSAVYGEN